MKNIPDRLVKDKLRKLQHRIFGRQLVNIRIRRKQGGKLPVLYHHALGLAGGSRCVDHVSSRIQPGLRKVFLAPIRCITGNACNAFF